MKLRFYTSVQDLLAHMLVAKNEMARIVGEFWQQFASLTGSYWSTHHQNTASTLLSTLR